MTAKNRIDRADVGRRLREERDRLGLSQDEMAAAGDVAKRTQAAWEKGEQTPNAEYLALISLQGADVHYVITGTHVWELQGSAMESFLAADEAELLANFRRAGEEGRAAARTVLIALARQE